MLLAQGNKISFKYEGCESRILEEVSFFINDFTKAGLVGKNGCGKTTLFQIILGNKKDYNGTISFKDNIVIGHLPQEIRFNEVMMGVEYLWSAKRELWQLKEAIDQICHDNQGMRDLSVFSRYDELGGYDFEVKLQKMIIKFDFSEEMLNRSISTFSGGEKTRLALFRIVLTNPDFLLLDEPTNHLDIQTLNWLEDYLENVEIPFLIISHDRKFLDRCINQIWEIEDRKLRVFSGNYSLFKGEKETEFNAQMENHLKQQKKIKQLKKATESRRNSADKMENFKFSRSVKKNGGICKRDEGSGSEKADPTKKMRSAKALEKRMDMMLEKEKADMPRIDKKRNVMFSTGKKSMSKIVLSIKDVTKTYSNQLFPPVNLSVESGSRVAFVGKNGSGKSTLLKVITGFEKSTTGDVYLPPSVKFAYYSQEYENLDFESRIIDEVIGDNYCNQTLGRTTLGCVGLEGDKVFQKIDTLSIGERSKVALVKTILSRANVLILDEPTNHLEIAAKEAIEQALENFEGTIIFVSHDRMFLEKLAGSVFDVESGEYYEGTYEEYLNSKYQYS
ncbi:MAG: ABC-F type ribosomal protection protein [Bacteriovoracaceae bacterium]|nr:ABC-F type ribosomal protection protein [Bacteriovoracaceae bacterium]